MNKNILIIVPVFIIIILSIGMCGGCGSDVTSPNIDTQNLTSDQLKTLLEEYDNYGNEFSDIKLEDGSDIYIDLSDGVYKYSYKIDNNKNIVKNLISVGDINGASFFDLSDDEITMIDDDAYSYFIQGNCSPGGEPFTDAEGILKQAAPIQKAINEIVKSNKISVLVTDGEFAETVNGRVKINTKPWAAKALGTWFSKGNSLVIVYSDFKTKQNYNKHMYTMFFIPKNYNGELLGSFIDDLKEDELEYGILEYNTDFKNLWHRDDYLDNTTPGTDKCNEVFGVPTFFKSDNFEYVDFTSAGFTSITGEFQMTESIRDGFDDQGNKSEFPLIEKLKFEFNNIENYKVNELSIDVYNITDDFNQFTKNYYALKNLPILEKSVSGTDSLDLDNNLVFSLSTPTIDWAYPYNLLGKTGADTINKFSPMLENAFKYSGPNYSNVVEFLEIDIEAGKASTKSTTDNVFEVVIDMDNKLNNNTKNLNLNGPTLIKLDVVVEKEQIELKNIDREPLQWQIIQRDQAGEIDNSLYKSIKNTLKSNVKEKKILYTYYLKFPQLND